ncbi:hypothetical protein ACFY2K_43455 [Kitasatospora sp. NPDC001309]|uniref:hypothetical protein n=1 Tax=Kitasatospora sp. NPDC001309 TaxID=3364013 RepID=UPI0036B5B356
MAGAVGLSLALRPVAQSLGELALMLDRPQEAADHFARAERVAHRWHSPHWADAARADLAQAGSRVRRSGLDVERAALTAGG